ncbi:OmpA family protein [Chitinophagaceae bacterium MMS25-I14]
MVNKKYLLLAGLCTVMAAPSVFAQESGSQTSTTSQWSNRDMTYRGESYDVLDSSYVPKSRMEQHRKFLNHQYEFPSKPRNMWEIGVGGGLYNVSGDVPSLMLWNKGGWGVDVHVRKALGYVMSLRADYTYGIGKGLQWQPSLGYINNPAWNGQNNGASYGGTNTTSGSPVFYNYRTESHQLNLDLIAATNNIRFHKAKTGLSLYAFAGIGGLAYQTWINALDANFQKYNFQSIIDQYGNANGEIDYSKRKDVRKALQGMLDDSYETDAETSAKTRRPGIFNKKTLDFVASFGVGAQIRLSKRFNISIEDRITTIVGNNEDLLDGQRWAEQVNNGVVNAPVRTQQKDGINYASVGLNFNLGAGKKNVEPLYWLNPLDYSYGELSAPRHMVLPEPVLSDADGDGIADQFDKCPGTPSGVAVDSHGCPMDTDGDGVPDDRDKQLITPTECQPVDADGVGKCPCPDGCGTAKGDVCGNIGAGSITFGANSSKIAPAMQAQLATLAAQMQANPTCKVVIIGQGNTSKVQQQRSWDRVNAIIEYMSEKNNIDRNRFIFQYGQAGDPNSVMYRSAQPGEEGPGNVPPPFPNLRKN